MKIRLLDFLRCPCCRLAFELQIETERQLDYPAEQREAWGKKQSLALTAQGQDAGEVWQKLSRDVWAGSLICPSTRRAYQIIEGVPLLVERDLRASFSVPADDFQNLQRANHRNYSFQWQTFAHEYDKWFSIYRESYVNEAEMFFPGKLGLDAGCGMARYSLPPVKMGAEVIGLELSDAVFAAYQKSLSVPAFHVVGGDLFNLPFADETFDFAQSLGVLHHTPDPERGLASIRRVVKTGGKLFIYVYQSYAEHNLFKHVLLQPVTWLRHFTSRMPARLLYWSLLPMVVLVYLLLFLPSLLLWYLPGCRRFSHRLPYNFEQYRGRRLRDFHMNLFDRFGNPTERRYRRSEMERWLSDSGLRRAELRANYGWNVSAVK